jgi:hypothetical protein
MEYKNSKLQKLVQDDIAKYIKAQRKNGADILTEDIKLVKKISDWNLMQVRTK